jgi:DNA-binding HxlR family transcriptional regulator
MLGKTYETQVCSAARALEFVGERWTLLIVRDALFAGATRFSDFHKGLGIATNVLTSRLEGLVRAGIMERRGSVQHPELHEYVLTEKGQQLAPVIVALTEWGDRWEAPDGPPVLYTHASCGGEISQQITCTNCGRVDDPAELKVRAGPGMPADRAALMATS